MAALALYDFRLIFRPGKQNADADGLSRKCHGPIPERPSHVRELAAQLSREREAEMVCLSEPEVKAMCGTHRIIHNPWVEALSCSIQAIPDNLVNPPPIPGKLSLPAVTMAEWKQLQKEDQDIGKLYTYREQNQAPKACVRKQENIRVRIGLREWVRLCFKDGVLHRRRVGMNGEIHYQLVLPTKYRGAALEGLHDDVGHMGQDRTMELVRARFYWPLMSKDVEDKIKSCERCTRRKLQSHHQVTAPLVNIQTTQPMELLCMDYLTIEDNRGGVGNILVMTDHFYPLCSSNSDCYTESQAYSRDFIQTFLDALWVSCSTPLRSRCQL
ncbi:uncharacterized protein LOC144348262 [Saccoglossus kowalevskii]